MMIICDAKFSLIFVLNNSRIFLMFEDEIEMCTTTSENCIIEIHKIKTHPKQILTLYIQSCANNWAH